jgi:hypothetical protein
LQIDYKNTGSLLRLPVFFWAGFSIFVYHLLDMVCSEQMDQNLRQPEIGEEQEESSLNQIELLEKSAAPPSCTYYQ